MKLIECPRDAMQGLPDFIPSHIKAQYINKLLQVGFDTIDFGSFVSPKAIPQLKDTAEVLGMLDLSSTNSRLLSIVANIRGAQEAVLHEEISYLGFPFSVSETFQQRNTNSNIAESLETIEDLLNLCGKHKKTAVVYLSMGFGNPYNDEWSNDIVESLTHQLVERGVGILSLSDTIGVSTPDKINYLFPHLVSRFPKVEFGVHLHSTPSTWEEKIDAAYQSGCRRFDSALKGFGGCPMATNSLTGNIATENVISYLNRQGEELNLNMEAWSEAMNFSSKVFQH
ncbi:hydroxymethylglutaryl-CoA lyase [Flavihumibacter sp. R14]|nr:hydroxymethylglutaryl-CoA lyase [Flavihumibacter soli]